MNRFKKCLLCLLLMAALVASLGAQAITVSLDYDSMSAEELEQIITDATAALERKQGAAPQAGTGTQGEAMIACLGDYSDVVREIQTMLVQLNLLRGTPDGVFGTGTEAGVKLFQKKYGLEETGAVMQSDYDAMKQAVAALPIATEAPVEAITAETDETNSSSVKAGDGWEITKEYYYDTSWSHYYCAIIKNTSGYDAEISCNVIFYDAAGNIVGVASKSEDACESGYETYWDFSNDMEFDHVDIEITVKQDTWYRAAQSSVELTSSIVGNKVILTAKNTGDKAVKFLEYNVLFLDSRGEIVSTGWGYLTDDDSEIKPGKTEMSEETSYEDFVDVRVYALGRINK